MLLIAGGQFSLQAIEIGLWPAVFQRAGNLRLLGLRSAAPHGSTSFGATPRSCGRNVGWPWEAPQQRPLLYLLSGNLVVSVHQMGRRVSRMHRLEREDRPAQERRSRISEAESPLPLPATPSITLSKSWAFEALSAMTFSSIVSFDTIR